MKLKVIIIIIFCIAGYAGNAQKRAAQGLFFEHNWKGVNWEPYDNKWDSEGTVSDANEIAACGIKWVRLVVNANDSFEKVDAMISQCKNHQLQILLCYNKSFPAGDFIVRSERGSFESKKLEEFVERYKNDIHYWEIQNEPNLKDYWDIDYSAGRGSTNSDVPYNRSVSHYIDWLKVCYKIIKGKDDKSIVILGGLSNWMMEDFMDRFAIEKGYRYCDEVAFHPYAVNERSYPDECISRLKSFQGKLAKWPGKKKNMPIWITEIGFHTGVINCPGFVGSEQIKATYLTETIRKLIQNLNYCRPIFWYVFHEKIATNTYFSLVKKYKQDGMVKTEYLPAYNSFKDFEQVWNYYK